jgi:tetratricopeptide (TPR) repeat protein
VKIKYLLLTFWVFTAIISCKPTEKINNKKNEIKSAKTLSNSEKYIIDGIFIDANKEKLLGNYNQALQLFSTVLSRDPNYAAAYYEIARINQVIKKINEAIIYAKKAIELSPDNIWYRILLSDLYTSNQQFKEATAVWEEIVKRNPDKVEYLYDWANAYIFENNLQEALKVYDLIEKKIGITEEISIQKHKIYLSLNKFSKAVETLEKLSAQYPQNVSYIAMIAELYMSKKMYDNAYVCYKKILDIAPQDKYINNSLAGYYREIGDKEKSYLSLKKGFANPNLDIDTKINILLSYYTVTEIYDNLKNQAFELTEILVNTHPNDPKSYSILADFLYRDKKYEQAREALRKVNSLDNSRYPIWETLLIIESELNDTSALIREGETAIQLFPEQPLLYLITGIGYYRNGQIEKALSLLQKGVTFVIDNDKLLLQFYTYLGDLYFKNNQFDKSFSTFKKALLIDPENIYILNNFTYYLALQNEELDRAEQMGRKLNELAPGNPSYQDTYGWVFYKLGRYDDAKKWLKKALESGGANNDIILEHMGDVYYKLGEKDKALDYWQRAKSIGNGSDFLIKKITDKKLYE